MQTVQQELTPVLYSAGAIKTYRFSFTTGKECVSMHWHERMEVLYVRQGEMAYIRGGEKGTLTAGQLLLIPPRMVHHARVTKDIVYDVLMFDVRYFYNDTDVCRELLPAVFDGRAVFAAVTRDGEVCTALHHLCREVSADSLEAVAGVYGLLHLLLHKGLVMVRDSAVHSGVGEITEYMESHFGEELSAAVLARRFGYTTAHFSRKFKKATGLPPLTYLKIYRLEQAMRLLRQEDISVGEIAAYCGFGDANYFTRCFTARYGHPPRYYKKNKNG